MLNIEMQENQIDDQTTADVYLNSLFGQHFGCGPRFSLWLGEAKPACNWMDRCDYLDVYTEVKHWQSFIQWETDKYGVTG